ncbi:hypothetical protein [Amycolatopsis sp. cmx-4-54]|uniref:hypothetical protein n=1 Tax=Amycolatopsis sp. cmx-4-54 TaxID=2790936 RepID=UPI00397D25B9
MSPDALHRTVLVVDAEQFSGRKNLEQRNVRNAVYVALAHALGSHWSACHRKDRGDGVFLLAPADFPKQLFVERIRLRWRCTLGKFCSTRTARPACRSTTRSGCSTRRR